VVVAAACGLIGSHFWTRGRWFALVGSFAYAISPLFVIFSIWGLMAALLRQLVPPELEFWTWCCCSVVFLLLTVVYSASTRHNALLDIVSCPFSLGLLGEP